MTALLMMRWQVIPANFVIFVIDLIFEIPQDHATEGKKVIIIIIIIVIISTPADLC